MTKKRDKRLSSEQFVPLYLEAVEAEMTREDFADKIGVTSMTVYQRIYEMHQKGACKKTFPQLQTKGRRSYMDKINAAVEEWKKSKGKGPAKEKNHPLSEKQPTKELKVGAGPKPKAKKQEDTTPPAETDEENDTKTDKFLESLLNG